VFEKEIQRIISPVSRVKGAFVAGGAVNSVFTARPINDYDVYFKTKRDLAEAIRYIIEDECAWLVSSSDRALTFAQRNHVIQFMHMDFYPTPKDVFDSFDFTICMGAVDLDTKEFIAHDDFLKHNSQRLLQFNHKTKYPIASALRMRKYQERGYTISAAEFLKVILACRIPQINSWEDLQAQLGGPYGDKVKLSEGQFSPEAACLAIGEELKCDKNRNEEFLDAESVMRLAGISEDMIKSVCEGEEVTV
jgi:hypothetical protein